MIMKDNDKLDELIQVHERHLKAAQEELNNENLTHGQHRELHVEIEKLTFSLETLNFLQND
jgi:hypothetical protein